MQSLALEAQIMNEAMRRALRPFDPGMVELTVLDRPELVLHQRVLIISCSLLVDDICTIELDALTLIDTPYNIALYVADKLETFYNKVLSEPVPDNVILGDS